MTDKKFVPPRKAIGAAIIGNMGRNAALVAAATGALSIKETMELKRMEKQRDLRMQQYEEDRLEMLTKLDPDLHKKFVLRWGLPHPDDWEDIITIMLGMHANRMVLKVFDNEAKLKSARFFAANGVPLPEGVKLVGDLMTGKIVNSEIVD